MTFVPLPGQDLVLEATEPVLAVLGGAGTGKTSVAAALVRQELEKRPRHEPGSRALFLSFSRSAVSQIVERTTESFGPYANQVEITTFHAYAWRLILQWGHTVGLSEPRLISPSEAKLFGASAGITFGELIPNALRILEIPAIRDHIQRRFTMIVCDEFQDTSDEHYELILTMRGESRLVFLGDLNQCIYTNLPGVSGVGPNRLDSVLALSNARRIDLPDVSHRDPSGLLPAAASAVLNREFDHAAVRAAINAQKLTVVHRRNTDDEGPIIAALVNDLCSEGHSSVGVFSHHVDATAALSDGLTEHGVDHDIVGLPDAVSSALISQFELLRFAIAPTGSEQLRQPIGIFITSCERGARPPDLARMMVGQLEPPRLLQDRLLELEDDLVRSGSVSTVLELIDQLPGFLDLPRGAKSWSSACAVLRSIIGPRTERPKHSIGPDDLDRIEARIRNAQSTVLTSSEPSATAEVQLMGLYQSKGREADATVVVLRASDYFGREPEPMPNGSRLLYVVLTRARKKTILLVLGESLPGLIAPLADLVLDN